MIRGIGARGAVRWRSLLIFSFPTRDVFPSHLFVLLFAFFWKIRSLPLAVLIGFDQFDTVQFAHVNRQEAVIRRAVEDVGESGVPDHFFGLVRRTRVDRLREGLVEAG